MSDTIHQFFDACHPFGYPLLVCSIILTAAVLYHLLITLSERRVQELAGFLPDLRLSVTGTTDDLLTFCHSHANALTREVIHIWEEKDNPSLPAITESRLRLLIDNQRAGMTTINIITSVAPMLGILGTAWGLVDIFGIFGTPGAEQGIAVGISKALYTTIFGLAIAVPGIIALGCFERALERKAALINELFTELLAIRNKL